MEQSTQAVGQPAPAPLAKRSEQEVCATWKSDGPPRVTVFCSTYNHVRYIESALCGFLGQITDFPFEIILVDDASTDGTTDIVRRFAEEYPRIIRPFIHKENNFQKSREGNAYVREYARGEIWAFCDGDDYWIYPHKLQSQVDLLDRRPDIQLTFHRVLWITGSRTVESSKWPQVYEGCVDFATVARLDNFTPPTSSIVSRRFSIEKRCYYSPYFDRSVAVTAATQGLLHGAADPWSVYRAHGRGIVSGSDELLRLYRDSVSRYWICRIFPVSRSTAVLHRQRIWRNVRRMAPLVGKSRAGAIWLLKDLGRLFETVALAVRLRPAKRS